MVHRDVDEGGKKNIAPTRERKERQGSALGEGVGAYEPQSPVRLRAKLLVDFPPARGDHSEQRHYKSQENQDDPKPVP